MAIHIFLIASYLVAALGCGVALRRTAAELLGPLLAAAVVTALFLAVGIAVFTRGREVLMAVLPLAAQVFGGHQRLCAVLEDFVAQARRSRFELIIIDHGFHTHVPYEFRMTWCKVWAAVGLADENLLREAAMELGLEGDTYKMLPLALCFLPYPQWVKHEFPLPSDFERCMNDEELGFPAVRRADKNLPTLWHLIMRVNSQVTSLFQMQYGWTSTTRYEFMRFMTRSALLGLRFQDQEAGKLPVPGRLHTATGDFFERETPIVEAQLRQDFHWKQKLFKPRSAEDDFLRKVREEIDAAQSPRSS